MVIGVAQQLWCMSQKKVNKGIEQYVRSVHIQLATVIGLHILVLGYFYPFAVITSIFVPATYFILYKWIELIYIIEHLSIDHM